MKKNVFICVCILMVMFCMPAYSTTGEFIDITKNLRLSLYDNSLPLDQGIYCVAVDSCGNVAMRSGSTQDNCDYIISVYSKTGEFLYGYEVIFKNQRGYSFLFFDDEDRLCYSATFSSEIDPDQHVLVIFDPHSTGYTSYALNESNYVSDGTVEYVNNIPVFISEHSPYIVTHCTAGTFGIRHIQTNQTYAVYDHLAAYNAAVQKHNREAILFALFATVFIVLLGAFLSWADNNRRS